MKQLLFIIFLFATIHVQATTKYVAVKSGLRVRAQPDINSEVLTVLPYGSEVIDTLHSSANLVIVNHQHTYWIPVQTEKGLGYVAEAYTLPFPPPRQGVEGIYQIEQYLLQITEPLYIDTIVYYDSFNYSNRTLYKNGILLNVANSEARDYVSIMIPEMTIQKAYMLMGNFRDFRYEYPADGEFPQNTDHYYYTEKHDKVFFSTEGGRDGMGIGRLIINESIFGIIEFVQVGSDVVVIYDAGC